MTSIISFSHSLDEILGIDETSGKLLGDLDTYQKNSTRDLEQAIISKNRKSSLKEHSDIQQNVKFTIRDKAQSSSGISTNLTKVETPVFVELHPDVKSSESNINLGLLELDDRALITEPVSLFLKNSKTTEDGQAIVYEKPCDSTYLKSENTTEDTLSHLIDLKALHQDVEKVKSEKQYLEMTKNLLI
jgi:hypothetical protein